MNAVEDIVFDLDAARRSAALQTWVEACKARMKTLWPAIDFDSNLWPIKSRYSTTLSDLSFEPVLSAFDGKDPAYGLALKCLIAEVGMKGDKKSPDPTFRAWRVLSRYEVKLDQLRRLHLTDLENTLVEEAQASPRSANGLYSILLNLQTHLDLLGAKGVIDRLAWSVTPKTKSVLLALKKRAQLSFQTSKASILDRQIEALSDAQTAMFRGDDRLSNYDRVALAVMGINMCCPNRVNEPLCMSLDDRFTLEDYLTPDAETVTVYGGQALPRIHQMLLVKGSKGAAWGAKPILNFMITFANLCIDVVKQHGERSRMLVSWYEKHPDNLFLPTDLEHLRGTPIDRSALWKIVSLDSREPSSAETNLIKPIWQEIHGKHLIKEISNPKTHKNNGTRNARRTIKVVAWADLEPVLLSRVRQAMVDARLVTKENHYQGRLSNMLGLFDSNQTPYLPGAIKYKTVQRRLYRYESDKKPGATNSKEWEPGPTLFEKLDIKMVVDGVVKPAYIASHDPRRWLTTQALDSGLSDVLANKWANRLNINQLKHYDIRSPEHKANRAAMPDINELEDLTEGLRKLGLLEAEYGLHTGVVVVGDASIGVTSMDDITQATEDRPVARSSNQIIILYPQKYGACLHQHHERPCRSYRCGPCNEGVVVKGHLPTNERITRDSNLVFKSIVNQLEALLIARQRQLADNPDTLDDHILTLVREGLNPEEMATELIERFHEINHEIKDRSFANKLVEAFALTGYAKRLKDPDIPSGALIKFHNPSYHAAPGHERALEAVYGGRASRKAKIEAFDRKHAQFAQTSSGNQDQRDLLEPDEDDGQEADYE